MLHTSLVRWKTKRDNYWDECVQEMSVAQNTTDIFLLSLVTSLRVNVVIFGQTYSILTHLFRTTDVNVTRHRSCCTHRWFVVKPSATMIEMAVFTKSVWHKTYQTFSCFPLWLHLESECRGICSILTHLFRTTNVNVTTHRSCFISQEVLDQDWRDSVPGKRCCQYLDLHNINYWYGEKPSTKITSSLCSVKLLRKRCLTVLINV